MFELVNVYTALVRPVLENCCQAWHTSLTQEQCHNIERVQKRVMKIIYPELTYCDALKTAGLDTLSDRREKMCLKLFTKMKNETHRLHALMPPIRVKHYATRSKQQYSHFKCRTNRFGNSFLPYCLRKYDV